MRRKLFVGGGLRHPAAAIAQLWSNDRRGLPDSLLGVVYFVNKAHFKHLISSLSL